MAWKISHSDTKPLSGGSAEIAAQPTRNANARVRHAVNEAAQSLHVALAGRSQNCAGTEEQQALEHRMVEHVQEPGGERQRRRPGHAVGLECQRQTQPDEDDPDILHRVIGQKPLEVVLHQRIQHAHHAGDAGERQHERAPPPRRIAEQVEHDAHEGVDGDLGHDAAHQRGNVAGGCRMRERKPDVQRHQPGLGAGAEQGQAEHQRSDRRRSVQHAHVREGVAAAGAGQQTEGQQQGERAEARHDQIDVPRPHIVARSVVRHDQRPRRQRHEFPAHEEAERIVGEDDEAHAGKECRIEWQHPPRRLLVLPVAEREQARARSTEADHGQEECGKSIETKVRADPGQTERQGDLQGRRPDEQMRQRDRQPNQRNDQAHTVDDEAAQTRARDSRGERGQDQQRSNAGKSERDLHDFFCPISGAAANPSPVRMPLSVNACSF